MGGGLEGGARFLAFREGGSWVGEGFLWQQEEEYRPGQDGRVKRV